MPKKLRRLTRLSLYFTNGASNSFVFDPKADKLEEKPTRLLLHRKDATTITVRLETICYWVVSTFEEAAPAKEGVEIPSEIDLI